MEWFQSLFSGDSPALTLVLTFFAIAALLIASIWLFRKIAGGGALKPGRNRQPRLSVTDAAIVDEKRRLVLVRRDNVEHLVMIGGPSDIVIEQNIMRVQPSVPPQQQREAPLNARQEREADAVRAARAVAARQERASEPVEPVSQSFEQPARTAPAAAPVAAAAALATAPQYPQIGKQELLLEPQLSELIDEPFVEPDFAQEPEPVFTQASGYEPEPQFEPEAEPAYEPQPAPAVARHDADFEFDLEGELERSFDVAPASARHEAGPSLESELTAELSDDLDFAKLLGEEEVARSTITTPEPDTRKPRRQESVDDEMQRLLDELANA
jgi:flagellar biogenesis protein FliO